MNRLQGGFIWQEDALEFLEKKCKGRVQACIESQILPTSNRQMKMPITK